MYSTNELYIVPAASLNHTIRIYYKLVKFILLNYCDK